MRTKNKMEFYANHNSVIFYNVKMEKIQGVAKQNQETQQNVYRAMEYNTTTWTHHHHPLHLHHMIYSSHKHPYSQLLQQHVF